VDIEREFRQLRELYPSIQMGWFAQIVRRVGLENSDRLRAELAEAERQTLRWVARQQKKEARRTAAAMKQFQRLEPHRALRLDASLPVPHIHVQLVLVYGFARPGSRRIFAGGHALKEDSVLQNVERKLGQLKLPSINRTALRETLGFLTGQGMVQSDSGKGGALSLNLDENAAGVTDLGRQIIVETKRFFHTRHSR